jgi:hypothetical protein
MPEARTASDAARLHPFLGAIETGDHAALTDMLAPDVELYSAVTDTPFRGKEVVSELYASVIEAFEELETVDELADGDTYALFWRGRIQRRRVEGVDRIRLDEQGKVREITIFGRPLSGLATFLTAIGPRFARRRRGAAAAAAIGLPARPLPAIFAALDPVTKWVVGQRSARRS